MARLYEPVWQRIKEKEHVQLKVLPPLVSKVKRGISKEKDEDVHFKNLNDHDKYRLQMFYDTESMILFVNLEPVIGLEDRKDNLPATELDL